MPRKKHFVQQSASKQKPGATAGKKKQPPEPETEDDFLDAADEHEKAAGKWRAGDAAKSARFFQRAIDAYAAGLAKYPTSFDLAYNKALLEYEITQDARIAREFKHPRIDMLKQTLESHLFAMKVNDKNVDVRFNTAQVMSDLAEELEEAKEGDGVDLYLEAILLMTQIFDDQEEEYAEWQAAIDSANGPMKPETQEALASWTSPLAPPDAATSSSEYATVEEAVTERAILDTISSLGGMVSDLMHILPPDRFDEMEYIIERTSKMYSTEYQKYMDKLSRERPAPAPRSLSLTIGAAPVKSAPPLSPWEEAKRELALGQAIFTSSYCDIHFRLGDPERKLGDPEKLPQAWYFLLRDSFKEVYSFPSLIDGKTPQMIQDPSSLPPTAEGVCAYADALLDLVDAISPSADVRRASEEKYIFDCNDHTADAMDKDEIKKWSEHPVPLDQLAIDPDFMLNLPLPDLYFDALHRALYLLTQAAPQLVEPEKQPALLLSAGDAYWRYRNAHLAFIDHAPRFGFPGASGCEARAVELWEEAARRAANVVSNAARTEHLEARAKVCISKFARGVECAGDIETEDGQENVRNTLVGMVKDGLIAAKVLDMANGVNWF
ncbi:hypothetical protein BKA80DRAFT_311230 [Phyllosticta citrichinensis]